MPVDHTVDVKSVRAYGPGLDQNNVREGVVQTFKVDASKAGRAPLNVDIIGMRIQTNSLTTSCQEKSGSLSLFSPR